MENWRRFLVKEAIDPRIRKKINMLLDVRGEYGQGGLGIAVYEMRNSVQFYYVWLSSGREETFVIPSRKVKGSKGPDRRKDLGVPEDFPYGQVVIHEPKQPEGPCSKAFVVQYTNADQGWGPLLYEVAIEWASKVGGGLTTDRFIVSDKATAVWEKYLQRGDVEKSQLDILHDPDVYGYEEQSKYDQLTPNDPSDDCNQHKSIEVGRENWDNTPYSKLYRKDSTEIIDALSGLGRWKTK